MKCQWNYKCLSIASVDAKDVTKMCGDLLTVLDNAVETEQRVTMAKLLDAWCGRGASGLRVGVNQRYTNTVKPVIGVSQRYTNIVKPT